MKQLHLIAFLLSSLILISCKGSFLEPEIPQGSRDYVWTVDTIRAINYLNRLWGASPDDVWAVGEFGPHDKPIWHFDGEKWEHKKQDEYISPYTIFGFASDNIWIGTQKGKIFHYNGSEWLLDFEKPAYFDFYVVSDIWGKSPDNVFSVGYADSLGKMIGVMFHYNGNRWRRISIDPQYITFHKIRASQDSDKYYIRGITKRVDTVKIYSIDHGKIKTVYSTKRTNYTNCDIALIDNQLYTVINNRIQEVGSGFPFTIINIELENFDETIFGRSRNDIFLRMWDGIAHYNGENSEYLIKFDTNQGFTDAFLFPDDVFILSLDFTYGYTLIYHGKITEK
jgi:hypothetical protein